MADFERDGDFIRVEHDGRPRRFRDTLFGHTFTDEELAKLVDGEQIEFQAVSKAGSPYQAIVRLEEYTYEDNEGNERNGFGPRLDFDEMNRRRDASGWCPAQWCGHMFTDEEKKILVSGGKVHLEDCVSKKTGNTFAADVTLGVEKPGESKRIIPSWNK